RNSFSFLLVSLSFFLFFLTQISTVLLGGSAVCLLRFVVWCFNERGFLADGVLIRLSHQPRKKIIKETTPHLIEWSPLFLFGETSHAAAMRGASVLLSHSGQWRIKNEDDASKHQYVIFTFVALILV